MPSPLRSWLKMVSSYSSAIAVTRHRGDDVGDIVAAAVGAPNGVLASARILPGNVVAARRLHRPDRRPAAELAVP